MSVRGSECSSVGGRRTPTQVLLFFFVLKTSLLSTLGTFLTSKLQESLPDAAKTMQLECSALASVGEGGNWQYLEGDVSGVRRYELLAPERHNSTFGSSSSMSHASFASSALSNYSVIADGAMFSGDVYCVKGVATVPAASSVVFDALMSLQDPAIKLWDSLFFDAQLDANPPPSVGQGSQALSISVLSSTAGGEPVVLNYLRSWKQQRDGTVVICLKRLDSRAATLSLPMRGYVIAPLDACLSLVSTITAADLSVHVTETDASLIKTEIVDSVTSIARLRSLLSSNNGGTTHVHDAATTTPSSATMLSPPQSHTASTASSDHSSPFARAAKVSAPPQQFICWPHTLTCSSSGAGLRRIDPVKKQSRRTRRAQHLDWRWLCWGAAAAPGIVSLLACFRCILQRRCSFCHQSCLAYPGAAHRRGVERSAGKGKSNVGQRELGQRLCHSHVHVAG
jgi:hypothetical protein